MADVPGGGPALFISHTRRDAVHGKEPSVTNSFSMENITTFSHELIPFLSLSKLLILFLALFLILYLCVFPPLCLSVSFSVPWALSAFSASLCVVLPPAPLFSYFLLFSFETLLLNSV